MDRVLLRLLMVAFFALQNACTSHTAEIEGDAVAAEELSEVVDVLPQQVSLVEVRLGAIPEDVDLAQGSDVTEALMEALAEEISPSDTTAADDQKRPEELTAETATEAEPIVAVEPRNLWPRLFSLYALPQIDNPRIDKELRFLKRRPSYIRRVQARAKPYLSYIVNEIEKNQLPGELALLPVIESAFDPYAYSHAKASGMWQFIPSTGRYFGLEQNWWYDGRRDVHTSTQAAISYFKKLGEDFNGDWLLALAAYNCGEGAVARAIKRNRRQGKATDYWSLRLPSETLAYVPRLLAVSKFFANADNYGLNLDPIPDRPVFELVDIESQIDLARAADIAEMTMDQLYMLNPGFNHWLTAPDGPHHLLVPAENSKAFRERLAALSHQDRVRLEHHVVKRGETLRLIAARYGSSVNIVRQLNGIRGNIIHPDAVLEVPVASRHVSYYARNSAHSRYAAARYQQNKKKAIYTVKAGDSLWKIANQHAISMDMLKTWNNVGKKNMLHPGQKLTVWVSDDKKSRRPVRDQSAALLKQRSYVVRPGDSLYSISQRFNVTIGDIRKWNGSTLGDVIHPGQELNIFAAAEIEQNI